MPLPSGLTIIIHGIIVAAGILRRLFDRIARPLFRTDEDYAAWRMSLYRPIKTQRARRLISFTIVTILINSVILAAAASLAIGFQKHSNFQLLSSLMRNYQESHPTIATQTPTDRPQQTYIDGRFAVGAVASAMLILTRSWAANAAKAKPDSQLLIQQDINNK